VPVRASELVAAPFAAPPLLAGDDAKPDQAATAAPRTGRKSGDHQDTKTVNSSSLYKIRH
jgi:hypothetical protein